MLRFYGKNIKENYFARQSKSVLKMDKNIWQNCPVNLKIRQLCEDYLIDMIPIKNELGEFIAYAYQDDEANRELRMLKELKNNKDAFQFTDIYPEYKEAVIIGCNELAVAFAQYLLELGVSISVLGKYWNYFGFKSNEEVDLNSEGKLIVYAEGIIPQNIVGGGTLIQTMKRSVSPEFECIDKIYEKNVLEGIICDATGTFDQLIYEWKDKQEIVILGDDHWAQDAYDLLLQQGIDIFCFAVIEKQSDRLLGKKVLTIADAIKSLKNPIFINCTDTHSALGEKWTEIFDYMGYVRNKQYFLLKDYAEIPVSNLVHVLYRKRVLLAGDIRLCELLSKYLNRVEKGNITIIYSDLSERLSIDDGDILCLVIADYRNRLKGVGEQRKKNLIKILADANFINYTKYFAYPHPFASIDLYLNQFSSKYSVPELMPKGILIGRILWGSGNVFFRGILDGHPEILEIPYSDLNENLYYYCIRLANIPSDKLINEFWNLYNEEAQSKNEFFKNPEQFEASINRFLPLKKSFTSQELFVLLQIAYAEMISGKKVTDINKITIYWEPHFVSRDGFPFYALWLEDQKVKGQTVIIRRNNIVRVGSGCKRKIDASSSCHPFYTMFWNESEYDNSEIQYKHWNEFKMRFEDIKVKPQEKLKEICERLDISWSDSMLKTTVEGNKPYAYRGSVDFELKAVFTVYEDFLSEFDRFRVSLASSPYQMRYGYVYENCLKYSRRDIQEWFLKPFRFDEILLFGDQTSNMKLYQWVMWQLWEVRKKFVYNRIRSEFDFFDLMPKAGILKMEHGCKCYQNEIISIQKLIQFVNTTEKLVLYGTGYVCNEIIKYMGENVKSKAVYCDRKAENCLYQFHGIEVVPPSALCSTYKEYTILVTSGKFIDNIRKQLTGLGIKPSRIFYANLEL